MVLVTVALAALVEHHRARFCAEGRGRCLDLAVGGVQVLEEYREEVGWELVVDRVRWTGIMVERKGFEGCCGNPSSGETVGGWIECRNVVDLLDKYCRDWLLHVYCCSSQTEQIEVMIYRGREEKRREKEV